MSVSQNLQKCQKSTRGDTTGKTTTASPATQPNVTVANQFTVKLQRAPKASRKNTCISFIYHSYQAIPILFASRSSTCTPINFITQMNKFVSWQTNGPQDPNIILNQLLDHPFNLQENLRQRSFVAASEWFQESVSRTCFPVRTKAPFSAAMRINLHHHLRGRQHIFGAQKPC
jgi:hypothetical protein